MKSTTTAKLNVLLLTGSLLGMSGCSLLNSTFSMSKASNLNLTNSNVPGVGSSSAPTASAVVSRIVLGLTTNGTANANPLAGNFKSALSLIGPNLPSTSNPLQATGFDQVPLLVYAACSDVNPTAYSVNTGNSVQTAKPSLVSAGMTMLDQHLAGLASGGPASAQVQSVLSTLVDQDAAAGDSTATTFISVCMAANTYGVAMRGF